MTGSAGQRWERALLVAVLAAGTSGAAPAQKSAMPDAQVEANVLRTLASAPELSTQNIQSTSVYGTVTLTGNVHDEALRTKAENLVARADGVKKVIDELTLGDTPAPAVSANGAADGQVAAPGANPGPNGAPPEAVNQATPDPGPPNQVSPSQASPGQPYPQTNTGVPAGSQPYGAANQSYGPQGPPPNGGQGYPAQPGYAQDSGGPQYAGGPGTPGQPGYPAQPGYAAQPGYRSGYPPYPPQGDGQQPYYGSPANGGGQPAGVAITVPSGATLQVRMDRGIDSNHIQPGTPFTGTVLNDVAAGGLVAIPRGAQVQGTVVDAKQAGALKGEGALALQLTAVTLGGQNYPVNTAVWERAGHDKTLTTVNSALGLGALGAVFGGLAGGGAGAAIGAGVGGAVGVGASAATPGGRVIVPPESVLTFTLAQPLGVKSVSQGEMQRLAYAAGPGPGRPVVVRRRPYPYGPYPGYYAPYGPYGYWR